MSISFLSHLECPKCQARLDADTVRNLCACGSPLLARYDLEAAARAVTPNDIGGRPPDLWRYRELLPVRAAANIISLGEGCTPLLPLPRLGASLGFTDLRIKDEGLNPSGTFKSRGATVGVSRARELGVRTVAMPTAGNAGGAWALYGARAGIDSVVVMPGDAESLPMKECVLAGARTYLVRGLVTDAAAMIGRAAKRHGWFEVTTLKEPYRIEGKKTMGYEIAEQLGWTMPDAILCPTGGGVGIISIYKALHEMIAMGWLSGRLPKLIAVQAEGCRPIVDAFDAGLPASTFFQGANTVASGLRVPKALGDFLVLEAVRATGGTCVAISDEDILEAVGLIGRLEGLFICPEGAALVPAARKLLQQGFLRPDERVVLLNTGTGLKYPQTVVADLSPLSPGDELPA